MNETNNFTNIRHYANAYYDEILRPLFEKYNSLSKERDLYKIKKQEDAKNKIISKISEITLDDVKINEKSINRIIEVDFSDYKNESLFQELKEFIECDATGIRHREWNFIMAKTEAQSNTRGFSNVQEIDTFIDDFMKDSETMKFINKIKNM